MTLPGVTPFPPEFAARFRPRGYWEDRPLIAHFLEVFDRVTHIHVVPALLNRWINDAAADRYDLGSVRVIQSGGQRLQPQTRLRTERVFRNVTVQENFGMAEGLLMFVRLDDPPEVRLETVGRPICPDDEVRLVAEDGTDVAAGEIGELLARGPYTLRGYYNAPQHNERAFSADGFYHSGDLMWRHPSGKLRGSRPQQGPDQPGRGEDLRGRGREPHPLPSGRAERGVRAGTRRRTRRAHVRLRDPPARVGSPVMGSPTRPWGQISRW